MNYIIYLKMEFFMLLFWKKKFNPNENNLMAYQWNFIKQLLEIEIECNEYKRKEIFVATI